MTIAVEFRSPSRNPVRPAALPVSLTLPELEQTTATAALTIEFLRIAHRVAVTASMANARASHRTLMLTGSLGDYVPGSPDVYAKQSGRRVASFFDRSLTGSLADFYSELEQAIAITPLDREAWAGTANGCVDWDNLKSDWQALCGQARLILIVLCEFDLLTGSDQITRLLESEQLLKAAWSGATPCIRSDGSVVVPDATQQRAVRRIPLQTTAWLRFKTQRVQVVLKDLSVTGVGLSSCPRLQIGTSVAVEFPGAFDLQGMVQWAHDGNIGVSLSTPLQETDAIFQTALIISQSMMLETPAV